MLLNNSVRRAVCVFSLALLGAGSAWGGETLDAIRNTGRMTLGYRENAIPFSWKTKSGQVVENPFAIKPKEIILIKK